MRLIAWLAAFLGSTVALIAEDVRERTAADECRPDGACWVPAWFFLVLALWVLCVALGMAWWQRRRY